MTKLFGNNPDGANPQAQAVLAYLRAHAGIEQSWKAERHHYEATPEVDRWHNCREQGYVVTLRSKDYKRQLNIAFFEHRNSDSICAVEWDQHTINPPTIDTFPKDHPYYNNKFDTSHSVDPGKVEEMAGWIFQRLTTFWVETSVKVETVAAK